MHNAASHPKTRHPAPGAWHDRSKLPLSPVQVPIDSRNNL